MDLSRSTLISKNIVVSGRRTSVRLEPSMWEALNEICKKENISIHEICTYIDMNRQESTLTSALRVYILAYFRNSQVNGLRFFSKKI